jgi:hypothetical protein
MSADQQPQPLTDRIAEALSIAGVFCGDCGFEPGDTGCPDCVRVRGLYVAALLPLFDAEVHLAREAARANQMAVVGPELAARDAQIARLTAELEAAQNRVDAVLAMLPAGPADDINASWIPPRKIRAAAPAPAVPSAD